jgi:hypothetical protein
LRALAPEASGVETPDQATLFVGTEVPTSKNRIQGKIEFGQKSNSKKNLIQRKTEFKKIEFKSHGNIATPFADGA